MSHNRLARLLSLGILVLLLALIWALDRVVDSVEASSAVDLSRVDFIAEKISVLRFGAEGSQNLQLSAGSVRHVPQDDATQFADATLVISRPGEAKTTITAQSARSVHRASEVFLDGEVKMRREADAKLDALTVPPRRLRIDAQAQIAQTDAPVEVCIMENDYHVIAGVRSTGLFTAKLLASAECSVVSVGIDLCRNRRELAMKIKEAFLGMGIQVHQ